MSLADALRAHEADPLVFYASRTGTRRNLAAFERAGWRLLVSAAACLRTEGFSYALDNGAWSYCDCKGTAHDPTEEAGARAEGGEKGGQ